MDETLKPPVMEKKPVKYATAGNWESLRRCFFQVRALMSKKIIEPHRLKAAEIRFIRDRIRENTVWTLADAFTLYHILKRYKPDLLKVGIDFRNVTEPKNPDAEPAAKAAPAKLVPTVTYLADKFYFKFNSGSSQPVAN